jgi:hypothetical protein
LRARAGGTIRDAVGAVWKLQAHLDIIRSKLVALSCDTTVFDAGVEEWEELRDEYGVAWASLLRGADIGMLGVLLRTTTRKRKADAEAQCTSCVEPCDMVGSGGRCFNCWQKDKQGEPGAKLSRVAVARAGQYQHDEAVTAIKVAHE